MDEDEEDVFISDTRESEDTDEDNPVEIIIRAVTGSSPSDHG